MLQAGLRDYLCCVLSTCHKIIKARSSWGGPFFVVVHLLYNRRLWRVVLAFAACFIALFVLHYTCHKITKGSLYRGAGLSLWWYTYYIIGGFVGCLGRRRLLYRLVGVALHMPQDNKRVALSWGEPFFVVVHPLYNRRLWRVVLAVAACFIVLLVLHYKCKRLQITFAIHCFVILY